MGCKTFGVTQVLVGLHRIGVVGLKDALDQASRSGLSEREALLDLMITQLANDNYIPESQREGYRLALWREYQRARGEDISDLYSEVAVTLLAAPGPERDQYLAMLTSVLAELELKPVLTFAAPTAGNQEPQLVIRDEIVASGPQTRQSLKIALRKSVSDW